MKPFAAVVEPVFETEKRVVVAVAVEEPIAKSVVLVEPLFAWIANCAHGDVEAIPTVPLPKTRKVEVPSEVSTSSAYWFADAEAI